MKPNEPIDTSKAASEFHAQAKRDNAAGSKDENRDPITGESGSHAVGVGLGAAGAGAAVGAVGGAVAGPVGMVAGAVIGAVAGGVAGKAAAEVVNPTQEEKFWREQHASRPYARGSSAYEDYASAYKYGWESAGRVRGEGQTFENVEGALGRGWNDARGTSGLGWNEAREATRDAWNRVAGSGDQRQTR